MNQMERQEQIFAKAVQLHRAGNPAQAVKFYEKFVRKAPRHAGALNLLGIALTQLGELERAAAHLEKAVALDPTLANGHFNLGTVLQKLERFEAAVPHFEKAVAQNPRDAELLGNLGICLKELDRAEEAMVHLQRAAELAPMSAAAQLNLGNALVALERHKEALAHYQKALNLNPMQAETYSCVGNVLLKLERGEEALEFLEKAFPLKPDDATIRFNYGNALIQLDRPKDALAPLERAIELRPDYFDAYLNLGAALKKLEEFDRAISAYESAISLQPENAEARIGRAIVLNKLDRHDEALAESDRALALSPDHLEALLTKGNALRGLHRFEDSFPVLERAAELYPTDARPVTSHAGNLGALGRLHEAAAMFERAMAVDPDHPEARHNLSFVEFELGQFANAWDHYEFRWVVPQLNYIPRPYTQPRWNGERVEGVLLAWAEQGLGDHIIYGSMIPELRERADRLVVEIAPRLVTLFQRSFPVVEFVPLDHHNLYQGRVDAQTPFGSMGRHLRTSWESFPRFEDGYLVADAARAAALRARIAGDGRRAIGISWSSKNKRVGKEKTADLAEFAPLLRQPGLRFVDLQYGDTTEERRAVEQALGIEISHLDDIDNTNDIDGLAALIAACDAVVTTSNTTAHLAGALGKPTWVLLPFGPGKFWYWFLERSDSPWYPKMRLQRRGRDEAWHQAVAPAAEEVRAYLDRQRGLFTQ